jgi:adenylate cyclase
VRNRENPTNGLIAELKRRNVFRVALFYVVSAWLIIEVAETVLPLFDVPDGVLRGLVVLLVIGLRAGAGACRGSTSSRPRA